jgi:hypothetical protein
MEKLKGPKKFTSMALTAVAIVLAINAPSQVQAAGGHGGGGGHSGGSGMHDGFGGHDGFDGRDGFDGHHGFDGHRDFGRREHRGFGFGSDFTDDGDYPETYSDQAPAYYCPSYDAYYPSVTSCPESWEPVPAS